MSSFLAYLILVVFIIIYITKYLGKLDNFHMILPIQGIFLCSFRHTQVVESRVELLWL